MRCRWKWRESTCRKGRCLTQKTKAIRSQSFQAKAWILPNEKPLTCQSICRTNKNSQMMSRLAPGMLVETSQTVLDRIWWVLWLFIRKASKLWRRQWWPGSKRWCENSTKSFLGPRARSWKDASRKRHRSLQTSYLRDFRIWLRARVPLLSRSRFFSEFSRKVSSGVNLQTQTVSRTSWSRASSCNPR